MAEDPGNRGDLPDGQSVDLQFENYGNVAVVQPELPDPGHYANMVPNPVSWDMQFGQYPIKMAEGYKVANNRDNGVCVNCYPGQPSMLRTRRNVSRLQNIMNNFSNYIICGQGLC